MRSGIYQLQCHTCHLSYMGPTGQCLEQRYKEWIRYVTPVTICTSYSPQQTWTWTHECHLVLNHTVHKSLCMNLKENFCTHHFQQHNSVIFEQFQKDKNPLFDPIYNIQLKHECAWPIVILSHLKVNFSTVQYADATSWSYLVRNILTTVLSYSLQYVILIINILITLYTHTYYLYVRMVLQHTTQEHSLLE